MVECGILLDADFTFDAFLEGSGSETDVLIGIVLGNGIVQSHNLENTSHAWE